MFVPAAIQTLTSSTYEVTPNSDRMGCRLDGPMLEHLDGPDVISDGTAFGVIQVPGDGKPIILYASRSKGSDSYVELAQEVIQRTKNETAKVEQHQIESVA
jgi:allophanate hydrolase subunit 2